MVAVKDIENGSNGSSSSEESHDEIEIVPLKYKEAVVIGNGPSGIALSYFLAGNWPNYNGQGAEVNEMLHYRLMSQRHKGESILEQDLDFLAQGLEGRSRNPIALLYDTLNHPQADLGHELPSLLDWVKHPDKEIDHVVIGRGRPGGAWQKMEGNVLTISLGTWMELPGLSFRDWEVTQESRRLRDSRASVASVAQYYCDYIKAHDLGSFFLSHSVVTKVSKIQLRSLPYMCDHGVFPEVEVKNVRRHTVSLPIRSTGYRPYWEVEGYTIFESQVARPFRFVTRNVILASGNSDEPNVLNIPGENLPFVLHSLKDLEQLITSKRLDSRSKPILVVGAGLSAADAVIAARFHNIPVRHIFRRQVDDENLIFRRLPQNLYPEYHKVYQMMRHPLSYEGYKALDRHVLMRVGKDRIAHIQGPERSLALDISFVVICIGSHPNLSFMGDVELNLGRTLHTPIDCKDNPVDVACATHESIREPGLYAMGPLVGENFVRFVQGGALAITSHVQEKIRIQNQQQQQTLY